MARTPPTTAASRTTARRVLDRTFSVGFALYVVGLLLWLAVGLLPPLISLVPALRDAATSVAEGSSGLAGTAAHLLEEQPSGSEQATWALAYLFSALNLTLGLLLAVRLPRQLEARLLSLAFIGTAATFNQPSHVVFHLLTSAPVLTAVHFAFHVVSGVAYLWAMVLFPDGRLPTRASRRATVPTGVLLTALVAWICWRSSFIEHPPFFVAFFGVLVPIIGIAVQTLRIRQAGRTAGATSTSRDLVRVQQSRVLRTALVPALVAALLWLLLHAVALLVGDMATGAGDAATRLQLLFPALFAVVPVALFIALLRLRLWDVDLVLRRGLLVSFVVGAVSVLYVGVLVVAAAVGGGDGWTAVIAVALAALVAEPLRRASTRLANRVAFGQELSPREALRRLTDQLALGGGSDQLDQLCSVVVAGTRASAAAVWVRMDDELVRAAAAPPCPDGSPDRLPADAPGLPDGWLVLPVSHDGAVLGLLAVRTPPGVGLPPAERRLVDQLAAHAGMLVANALLTRTLTEQVDAVRARRRELVVSRRSVVTAQDTERRRLERDLHDGAQQELVAFLVHVSTVAALLRSGRAPDAELVAPAAELLRSSVETVEALTTAGAPAVLLEHGLSAALRQAGERAAATGVEVRVDCRLPEQPELSVARVVYLTVVEALQNATKHARARRIDVHAAVDDGELRFGVTDDGVGFDPRELGAGSAVDAIGRRVMDAGGVVELTAAPGAGTRLDCRLPVTLAAPEALRVLA